MPFPDTPRVLYSKNPLDTVICQLRFPPILRIDTEIPDKFQERIRDTYPFYYEKSLAEPPIKIKDQLPQEIAKLMFNSGGGKKHDFVSSDKRWTITLTKEFIALTSQKYTRWEEFINHFQSPLEVFVNEYKPSFYSRIGLRYKNVIQKSILGLEDAKWSELLQPYVVSMLSDPNIETHILDAAHTVEIKLEDNQSQVRIRHGFVNIDGGETGYLIDSDFFTEQRTEVDNVFERLGYFNRRGGRLFRWCITDRLHKAMEPRQIENQPTNV